MITIDRKYDIILTFSHVSEITGHIFECFDYWLILREKYNVGILFLASIGLDSLKKAWDSKYNVSFDIVKDSIIYIDYETYKKEKIYSFDKHTVVILTDGDILALEREHIIFNTKKLIGFRCSNQKYEQSKLYRHIIYLQDYRLYNKSNYFKTFDYIKKIPFKYYKKSKGTGDNVGLIYMTFNCRKITPELVKIYHTQSGCSKTLLVVPKILEEYNNIEGVEQVQAPLKDFFNKFDTYIYTNFTNPKNNEHLDCSPRLLTECFIHNKNVIITTNYFDIGFETRYNDARFNFESLNLKEDDEIFKILNNI